MQQLQALAKSPIEHQLEEQRQEKLDEDDEGGSDDPVRYYRRLRKKVDERCADVEKNLATGELANRTPGCNNARGMKLTINGNDREFAGPLTLAALIGQLDMKEDRVAVELNRNIVTRDQWPQTSLAAGDRLEIVHFVGGGSPHHY
jgi:thiamine biosynthesis protein ThiS